MVYWAICEIFQVILINSKLLLSTRISCRYYTSLYQCNLIDFCSVIGKTYKPQWITRVETLTNNEKIEVYQTNYNIFKNYEYHEKILEQNPKFISIGLFIYSTICYVMNRIVLYTLYNKKVDGFASMYSSVKLDTYFCRYDSQTIH